MGDIVLGKGATTIALGPAWADDAVDPYGAGGFSVEARAEGVVATVDVFMLTFAWAELVAWFDELAAAWRGFDGVRTWRSIEGHLAIEASVDPLGHVSLSFRLTGGPWSTWDLGLWGIAVDAGEDLAELAGRLRAWVPVPG